ncbi:AAA family ATPase [Photobacterium indicum]|uniref:AAA family ATPase n=1 Tax=Photobacterium indicum TaxID=81447 RepID=UPI003D0A5479
MAYFIGIAGTHSTGKSTFLDSIEKQAKENRISVARICDTATKCQNVGFPILDNHIFESTLWIIVSVIRAELEAELNADLILVDRPVPDALGYLEAALNSTGRSLNNEQQNYLYDLVKYHSNRYDLLLKTTLDESTPIGEGRDSNMNYRRDAGIEINNVFEYLKIPYLDPYDNATQEHIQNIFDSISAKNKIEEPI